MTRHAFVVSLACLLFSTAAIAQTADLSVAVFAPKTASPGEQVQYTVEVTNLGPDTAFALSIQPLGGPSSEAFCSSYFEKLPAGTHATVGCFMRIPQSGSGLVGATVSHSGIDPNPDNNTATASVLVVVGPNLAVQMYTPATADPGQPFNVSAYVTNYGAIAATDTLLSFDLPVGSRVVAKPDNCTETTAHLVCVIGTLQPNIAVPINFTVTAPDSLAGGVRISLNAEATAREADPHPENNHVAATIDVYRMFWVTDVQGYSLNFALQDVNNNCASSAIPCKIGFRLYDVPGPGGFFTIHPLAPLQRITAPVVIDGTTQARYVGDTNPDGPEVFIDGTAFGGALTNGFEFETPCFEMKSLAIGNFSGAGVYVAQPPARPSLCNGGRFMHDLYIGVDASGTKAAPNGRGIYADFLLGSISSSVISGNTRSGIWISGSTSASITGNKIGLDANGHPLGNGGSGVFIGPTAFDTSLRDNFIAFNHDFGVDVSPGAYATYIPANAIYANWQVGIKTGSTNQTPKTAAPAIISATYDPNTNTTVIRASVTPAVSFPAPSLHFYAADAPHSSGAGEGQYFIGILQYIQGPYDKPVTFTAKGDLRGKWVCATETTNYYNGFLVKGAAPMGDFAGLYSTTSEFSPAVQVQ